MRYNIFDSQTGEYYEKNITLEQAKEIAIRFVERSMVEGDQDNMREYANILTEVEKDKAVEEVAESLLMFDYILEKA